jgi:hypothetical protein
VFTSLRVRSYRSIEDSGTLTLRPITVIIGRNNTGKSSLLRAVYQLQQGAPWTDDDIRIGFSAVQIDLDFDRLYVAPFDDPGTADKWSGGQLNLTRTRGQAPSVAITHAEQANDSRGFDIVKSNEPDNLIYPSLSGRRGSYIAPEEQVRRDATTSILPTDQNLVSRASTVMNSRTRDGREFADLCQRVLGDTLDIMTGQNGQRLGVAIDRRTQIGLDAMGMGVSGVLGLLINLSGARNKVFLIEEPENDLHPEALKQLLDVIVEKSADNQFLISTHSSIVLTRLGAANNTTVLHTTLTQKNELPTTTVDAINGRAGRLDVLRDLGYGLADLALADGWLIFEESSAERICRQYLIPWFAPDLARLNTIAAAGTTRVGPLLQNLHEMTLFARLEPAYAKRLWVITDGDAPGINAVAELSARFPTWPPDRFVTWEHENFEEYYPPPFDVRAQDVLMLPHDQRRDAKHQLLNDLINWIAEDEGTARQAFRVSAATAIDTLRRIAEQLTSQTAST